MKSFSYPQVQVWTFCLLLSATISACQTDSIPLKATNDLEEMELKGKVQKVTTTEFKASKNTNTGEIRKGNRSTTNPTQLIQKFNEDGNLIEVIVLNEEGATQKKTTYDYDENKRQVEIKEFFDEKEPNHVQVEKFDKKGNKIKVEIFYPNEDKPYVETFSYDKNGNLLTHEENVSEGKIVTINTYDEQGNILEKRVEQNDQIMMRENFEYDESGDMATSKMEENRTAHSSYINNNTYRKGKIIKSEQHADGEFDSRYEYGYNEQGLRTSVIRYDMDGNILYQEKTDHTFDDKDNWIQKTPLDPNGIPKTLIEREIDYY